MEHKKIPFSSVSDPQKVFMQIEIQCYIFDADPDSGFQIEYLVFSSLFTI